MSLSNALLVRLNKALAQARCNDAQLFLRQALTTTDKEKFIAEIVKMGAAVQESGDLVAAEKHFRLGLNMYERCFPHDHAHALMSLRALVEVLHQQNKGQQIERTLDHCYMILQRLESSKAVH